MEATSKQLLKLLKSQIILFMDELISIFPNEKEFVFIRFLLKDQIPIKRVMKYIREDLIPIEDHIEQKNEDFFLKNQDLDERAQSSGKGMKLNFFRTLWTKSCDPENKEIIWQWFKCFVDIGKRYEKVRAHEKQNKSPNKLKAALLSITKKSNSSVGGISSSEQQQS